MTLWWQRAGDLSHVIDGMLASPRFGPRIDPERIGAVLLDQLHRIDHVAQTLGHLAALQIEYQRRDEDRAEGHVAGTPALIARTAYWSSGDTVRMSTRDAA